MAAERKAGDFGARLREARERRGVALRTMADVTKISVRALEALERNDIAQLPGGIFSRSFVRAYAQEVGLDPEETIADFITQFPHDSVTQGHPRTRAFVDELDEEPRRFGGITPLRLVLVGIPVLAAGVYFSAAVRPAPTAPPVAEAARPAAVVAAAVAEPASRPARMDVTLRVIRACVVTIRVDDGDAEVLALEPGGSHRVSGSQQVSISVNDPSAVEWTINGSVARPLTGPVRVTPETVANLLAAR